MEVALTDYVAALCHMQGSEVVPSETERITADNDDDAVRLAVEWRTSTFTTVDGRAWLQVIRDGSAIFSKEIGRL
jgi:hypothetical protein